jgi:hypothetical protein
LVVLIVLLAFFFGFITFCNVIRQRHIFQVIPRKYFAAIVKAWNSRFPSWNRNISNSQNQKSPGLFWPRLDGCGAECDLFASADRESNP